MFELWQHSKPKPPSFPLVPHLGKKGCVLPPLVWVEGSNPARSYYMWGPSLWAHPLITVKASVSHSPCSLKPFSDLFGPALPRKPQCVSNKYLHSLLVHLWCYPSWHLNHKLEWGGPPHFYSLVTISLSLLYRYQRDKMSGNHWRILPSVPFWAIFFSEGAMAGGTKGLIELSRWRFQTLYWQLCVDRGCCCVVLVYPEPLTQYLTQNRWPANVAWTNELSPTIFCQKALVYSKQRKVPWRVSWFWCTQTFSRAVDMIDSQHG